MARIKVRETKEIFLDSDGFLRHASEWSHLVRDGLAKYHKIRSLTKEHHEVIVNLREMLDNYEKEDLFDEYQRRNLIPTTDRINMLFRNFGVALAVAGSMNPKKIKIEREVVAKGKARIRVFEKKIDVTQNMIKVVVDLDGFFIDSNDWTEELAQLYANTEAQCQCFAWYKKNLVLQSEGCMNCFLVDLLRVLARLLDYQNHLIACNYSILRNS